MDTNCSKLGNLISESVKEIDTQLKSAGYDMFMTDKESGTATREKIRRKVKVLESKSAMIIKDLEKSNQSWEQKLKLKRKRENDLEKETKKLQHEIKKLKTELDEEFLEIFDSSANTSLNASDASVCGSQDASIRQDDMEIGDDGGNTQDSVKEDNSEMKNIN